MNCIKPWHCGSGLSWMTATKVDTWEWMFFTLEPCAGFSLLVLRLGHLSLRSIALLSWTHCKRQYGRSSSQNSSNRSCSRQISGCSRLWSSCSPSVTILSVYCSTLQTAAGYRALPVRRDKGQYKVPVGMQEPSRLLLCQSWMPSPLFIHSPPDSCPSHTSWGNSWFFSSMSPRPGDNEGSATEPPICPCPLPFPICWPMSPNSAREELWNSLQVS